MEELVDFHTAPGQRSQRVVQKSMMRGLPARSFVNDDAVMSSSNNVKGRSGAAAARADMVLLCKSGRYRSFFGVAVAQLQLLMTRAAKSSVCGQMRLYAGRLKHAALQN